jgi:hypothetical protein
MHEKASAMLQLCSKQQAPGPQGLSAQFAPGRKTPPIEAHCGSLAAGKQSLGVQQAPEPAAAAADGGAPSGAGSVPRRGSLAAMASVRSARAAITPMHLLISASCAAP